MNHEPMSWAVLMAANEANAAKLEKKVLRLETALIYARLELDAVRPCLLCAKTKAQGCKADNHPYTCDGAVSK
jgi:hypothetical protein